MIAVNGRLQLGHLLRRHIAGDIAPVLIALMVVVGALRALADDADGAALRLLDLGDVMEDRLRGGLVIHEPKYMCNTYTEATKKGAKTQFEEICLTPPGKGHIPTLPRLVGMARCAVPVAERGASGDGTNHPRPAFHHICCQSEINKRSY